MTATSSEGLYLRELDDEVVRRLDADFYSGVVPADTEGLLRDFEREVSLDPLREVLEAGMDRFTRKKSAQSDSWFGPRIHAALRLTRREAARRGLWRFIAVSAASDYVRWRWGDLDEESEEELAPPAERFVGPDYKHAIARLWWMAELFRNGPDYAPAARALTNQDVTNNLFRMDIAHHRPTAQGAVEVLAGSSEEGDATGREANALAKAANAAATTLAIEAIAPDEALDEPARQAWVSDAGDYDPGLYLDQLPIGPGDPPVPSASQTSMRKLLAELLAEAPVRGKAS